MLSKSIDRALVLVEIPIKTIDCDPPQVLYIH